MADPAHPHDFWTPGGKQICGESRLLRVRSNGENANRCICQRSAESNDLQLVAAASVVDL